jgi:hypothetical protein
MTEPDVALTDYALAVECAVFAWLLWRRGKGEPTAAPRSWWVLFFASASLASLLGGTEHGFFVADPGFADVALWRLTLLAIGAAAFAGWAIGSGLLLPRGPARWVVRAAAVGLGAYAAVVLWVDDTFWVAIANYLPPLALLLGALSWIAVRERSRAAALAAAGVALMFVAAALQQLGIALHPTYFNHNALYHLVQAVALALLFAGALGLLRPKGGPDADAM